MIGPRCKHQFLCRIGQEGCACRIGRGNRIKQRRWRIGVHGPATCFHLTISLCLCRPGVGNPRCCFRRAFAWRREAEVHGGDGCNVVVEIDPVHERS